MPGIIYVIGPHDGPFKIGRTTLLERRLASYRTHSPVKMHVYYKTGVLQNYIAVERLARYKMRDYDLDYDWFDAPLQSIVTAVREAINGISRGEQAPRNSILRGSRKPTRRTSLNSPVVQPITDAWDAIQDVLDPDEDTTSFVRNALDEAIARRRIGPSET